MAGLVAMIVLVGMGEHMAERFLPLYLQELTRASGCFPGSPLSDIISEDVPSPEVIDS